MFIEGIIVGNELLFGTDMEGDGTDVTVIVKGFWLPPCAVLIGADVGVTVTLGVMVVFLQDSGRSDCSFAAERPKTISSSLRRFFSFPTTGSSIGCNGNHA